ncbi:golgi CORVET complex core vacuolar protein 8 [Nitzschia inconspicua]|uniref:Golgi CORVET complex core vacuolar protein 8 n=1 Tax=Nitzschia inconspicua TaxID=303405 RepID=A0A9K3LKS4_9STRA|nr:golgi CORVET complex core vacuolar protein 8 [Nitzschia inconspicua]
MDLQAILDSTDDDDDSSASSSSPNVDKNGNGYSRHQKQDNSRSVGGSSSLSPFSSSRKHNPMRSNIGDIKPFYGTGLGTPGDHSHPFSDGFGITRRGSGETDLEQILREDDDSDDDDGSDDDRNQESDGDNDEDYPISHNIRQQHFSQTSSSGLANQEWDILQAILGEEEDDDDDGVIDSYDMNLDMDDDEDDDPVLVKKKGSSFTGYSHRRDGSEYSGQKSAFATVSSSVQSVRSRKVDLILQQSDDEDDTPDDSIRSASNHRRTQPRRESPVIPDVSDSHVDSFATAIQSQESNNSMSLATTSSNDVDKSTTDAIKYSLRTARSHTIPNNSTNPSALQKEKTNVEKQKSRILATTDADLEKASEKALEAAKAQERKLLKSGHRDIVSPLMVKRRLKPKIELRSRMQSQQHDKARSINRDQHGGDSKLSIRNIVASASHPVTTNRFNFAGGIINTKTMSSVSKHLYDRCRSHQDLPTAIGINSRFIAVGTQKGIILVFDLFEVLRRKLGGNTANTDNEGSTQFNYKTAGSVTTIDLSLIHGEFLAAGYTGGAIVLWDTIKGVALKSVVEPNTPSPIVSVRFLSDLKLVTVDAGGLVNKLNFTKNMLWTTYSVESECLLDGTAGQILAMNVLSPYQHVKQQLPHDCSSVMKRLVLLALSSERSSFAVAVEPKVHVLHRWAKPELGRILGSDSSFTDSAFTSSQVFLPCLSWGWALVSGGGHVITPILARAWGCCIQLLRANFPESEDGVHQQDVFQWPAFGVHDEFDVEVPVVAMEWLNERSLVYLSMNNEFIVTDTVMMTLLERLDFSGLKLVYAEFSLSRKVVVDSDNSDGTEVFYCTTFQNSFRACDNRLLLLCQEELKSVSVVGARPRISALENDGEWLEALALALDHYESTIKSQEDRRRDPFGRRDLSKHPGFRSENGRTEDEEWIAKLLIRYVNIAVENAPETSNSDFPAEILQSQLDLARSHFQMLAGVCMEFCLVTKRLDLLFGPIFRRFHSAGFLTVFLDVLEPYILNDKLNYIAPEAMMHFVEHCRANNGLATVERCLLHMDVTIMDFDSILTLLQANEMYSALFHVYNQGLQDYTSPLEILCERIFDSADTLGQLTKERRTDGIPQNDFERYGYKAILYLQSCFKGKTFPLELDMPEDNVGQVRAQLLRFLLQTTYSTSRCEKTANAIGHRSLKYPYTHVLLMVDPRVMFDTFSIAMDASPEFGHKNRPRMESINGWDIEVSADSNSSSSVTECTSPTPDRQDIIKMLQSIMMSATGDDVVTHQISLYQSKTAINAFLDFLADYLTRGVIRADKDVTLMILSRISTRYSEARDPQERQQWQDQILSLLTALPRSSYDTDRVLLLVEKAGINRASLILHQQEVSSWSARNPDHYRRAAHFSAAIDCYLDDDSSEFRKEVYSYIKKECSGASDVDEPHELLETLVSKLTDLVLLDPLMSVDLAADLFVDDPDLVIRSLTDEEAKFMFLKAVISGELNEMDPVVGSVLNAQLTMDHHYQYMALMAKLHPEFVYDYLSSHDNYRPEECLQLCQKYDIADASAYLLERMGNVTSALQLILQTMESRLMNLKRTIRGLGTDYFELHYTRATSKYNRYSKRASANPELNNKQENEIEGLKRILVVALDVCERNSGSFSTRAKTQHGSQLWFNVLDRLINAKGFLRLSKEQPAHAKVMAGVLSDLLRLTMQRMVSSVPLPDLVRKVTSDHSGSRLGELREMIESLLLTYGLELDVFGGAVSVFHYDSRQMGRSNHSLRVRGSNVRSVVNVTLDGSSTMTMEEIRNNHELLVIGGTSSRNANVVVTNSPQEKQQQQELGLGDALSRLRHRRSAASNVCAESIQKRGRSTALNLMSYMEKSYREGLTSAEVTMFEERQIGNLGDAEHRGRIMRFMY